MDSLGAYLFPKIKTFTVSDLQYTERFQMGDLLDCGYHILYFVYSAMKDIPINCQEWEFFQFKKSINEMLSKNK